MWRRGGLLTSGAGSRLRSDASRCLPGGLALGSCGPPRFLGLCSRDPPGSGSPGMGIRGPRDLGSPGMGSCGPPGSGEPRARGPGRAADRTRMTSDGHRRWSSGVCPRASPKSSWKSNCAPCPPTITSRWWLRTSGEGCGRTPTSEPRTPRRSPLQSPPSSQCTPTLGTGKSRSQSTGALSFALPRLPKLCDEKKQTASLTHVESGVDFVSGKLIAEP